MFAYAFFDNIYCGLNKKGASDWSERMLAPITLLFKENFGQQENLPFLPTDYPDIKNILK